jgi:peptidoglycan/LPS O-acetylase OafA/YrhL
VRLIAASFDGVHIMHLTFLDLARLTNGTWPWINKPTAWVASLVLPFVLSWRSFRYVETPMLHRRPAQRLTPILSRDGVVGLVQHVHSAGGAPPTAGPAIVGANRD